MHPEGGNPADLRSATRVHFGHILPPVIVGREERWVKNAPTQKEEEEGPSVLFDLPSSRHDKL